MNRVPVGPWLHGQRDRPILPVAELSLSAPQSVNAAATATIALDTTVYDTGAIGDTTNHVLILKGNSIYQISALVRTSTVTWTLSLEVDPGDGGGYVARCVTGPYAGATDIPLQCQVVTVIATNATARLRATNNGGGAANVTAAVFWCTQIA